MNPQTQQEITEKTISIGSVKSLLEQGYKVEVTSPDGWVEVSDFVDKGLWDEYVFECNGKKVRCNEKHLFQATTGWYSAQEIYLMQEMSERSLHFLCDDGEYHPGKIERTGKEIPIVDIQVEHSNHRYYTNGISSHNTGVGKSLAMCHLASAALSQGKNVLYITLEMAEERIAERIDANLFDVRIDQLKEMTNDRFTSKVESISNKTNGKLVVKEYPTASAHVGHFRALLTELKMKKDFIPDVVYVDYLNICASSRIKGLSGGVNTYSLIKAIAEELRGLAVETNVPIWSATQVTRAGFCLDLNTQIETLDRGIIPIKDVKLGDEVLSNTGYNKVLNIFERKKKVKYRITTESGKTVECSENHAFPTDNGEKSIQGGLSVGDNLYVKGSS